MNDITLRNRHFGPEAAMQLAEERAPNGFTDRGRDRPRRTSRNRCFFFRGRWPQRRSRQWPAVICDLIDSRNLCRFKDLELRFCGNSITRETYIRKTRVLAK